MIALLFLALFASLSVAGCMLMLALPDWRSLAIGGICIVSGLIGLFVGLIAGAGDSGPGAGLAVAVIMGLMFLAVGGTLAGILVRATVLTIRGEPDDAPVPLRRVLAGLPVGAVVVVIVAVSWAIALLANSGR
jgi:hypothetical protein